MTERARAIMVVPASPAPHGLSWYRRVRESSVQRETSAIPPRMQGKQLVWDGVAELSGRLEPDDILPTIPLAQFEPLSCLSSFSIQFALCSRLARISSHTFPSRAP
jgi:hypothetical protein